MGKTSMRVSQYAALLFMLPAIGTLQAAQDSSENQRGAATRQVKMHDIRIAIGSTYLTATLEDNPTARSFVKLLPLTLTLKDYGDAEKISGALPRRLSQDAAPESAAGAAGDIAYYAPWGNIAFYRGRGPEAAGVIKIGKITSGIEALNQPGSMRVTISPGN
ncbi:MULTISPECIES: cyclophilin-like fold protein [unclassified Serratia (in: enterobacteria)]|uniref:cyclophilin-like fold protein n=1 Tax=unclassified Serratia (in: enterobacteria) TaxID=2647522 RepID=UPI002ED0EF0E|nr:cyclophilin-like fold protein [Serratia sp. C2(2)]MEE4446511.1 cyclophilin-like fold protein [Serratia sp. C2(1)]